MKIFEIPELQIVYFEVEDILTTSDTGGDIEYPSGDNMGDWA